MKKIEILREREPPHGITLVKLTSREMYVNIAKNTKKRKYFENVFGHFLTQIPCKCKYL